MSNDPRAETAMVPSHAGGALALLTEGRPETAKAMVRAISCCHAVEKNSTNSYHKYRYASADAIIETAREALASAGLALLPMEASLNGSERSGPDRFELVRTFVLLHESGEMTPLRVCWPVVPDNGRPLDKATAIADTLSLSYLLRDLLMMPRVDPSDDLNGRDDRSRPQPVRKSEAPADGDALAAYIRQRDEKFAAAGCCKAGELSRHIIACGGAAGFPDSIADWNAQQIAQAMHWGREFRAAHPPKSRQQANGQQPQAPALPPAAPPRFVTSDKARELQDLMHRKGRHFQKKERGDAGESICRVFDLPDTTMIEDLTPLQYAEIKKALLEERDFVRS